MAISPYAVAMAVCLSFAASLAHAQEQTPAAAPDTTIAQSANAQTAAQPNTPRSYWEPGAGFDIDSHSTGYGWFGPTYQRYLNDNTRLVLKAKVNYLFYEYETAAGRTKVSGPGVGANIGLKFGQSNWFRVTAGPSFSNRNTRVVFPNGSEDERDGDWDAGFDVGADTWFSPADKTNVMLQAQYGTDDGFYWTRGMARRQVTNFDYTGRIANFLGGEAIGMGNDDFRSVQVGGLWEIMHVPSSVSIQLRAGWKQQSFDFGDNQSGPYIGIGYWHRLR